MNKRDAFNEATRAFPMTDPARMQSCATAGQALLINGHEKPTTIVVYDRDDLLRLRGMIDLVLNRHPEVTPDARERMKQRTRFRKDA